MEVIFKKDFYQKTLQKENGNNIILNELYPMYHLNISKNYFEEDKATVLKMAIEDLKQELKRLETIDKNNDLKTKEDLWR